MIRRLASPPAGWNGRWPAPPTGALSVNTVEDNGTKLAAYWDDGDARAMTDTQWAGYVTNASYAPSSEEVNQQALLDAARQALTTNRTYVALASPTAAQTTAEVKALARQMNAVIRMLLGDFTGTD